jgi:hypothetical protein
MSGDPTAAFAIELSTSLQIRDSVKDLGEGKRISSAGEPRPPRDEATTDDKTSIH